MDDFILLVQGAKGLLDFPIYLQVPHSPAAPIIAEALAHYGLRHVIKGATFRIHQNLRESTQKKHFSVEVIGWKTKEGTVINTFLIYLQMPYNETASAAVSQMLMSGLRLWLGAWCQNIKVEKVAETRPADWEEVGAAILIN